MNTFELSKATVGLQPTIEEVQHYDEVRIHYRQKCKQCKCYLSKGTISIFCLRCSRKKIDIS